jgi:hypothetical protein
MNFLRVVIAVVVCFVLQPCSTIHAQKPVVIADVNFDDQQPGYGFGLTYGGYKLVGGDEQISVAEMLSFSTRTISVGGNGGSAYEVTLDKSKLKLPEKNSVEFVYLAVGSGINGKLKVDSLKELKPEDYLVSFDAKVVNANPLRQSRCELSFVAKDGTMTETEKDGEEDQICKLNYGGYESGKKLELTNKYQSFQIELSDMSVTEGSLENFTKYDVTGVVLIVIAEDVPAYFGVDGDTRLVVDNFRLIKK